MEPYEHHRRPLSISLLADQLDVVHRQAVVTQLDAPKYRPMPCCMTFTELSRCLSRKGDESETTISKMDCKSLGYSCTDLGSLDKRLARHDEVWLL